MIRRLGKQQHMVAAPRTAALLTAARTVTTDGGTLERNTGSQRHFATRFGDAILGYDPAYTTRIGRSHTRDRRRRGRPPTVKYQASLQGRLYHCHQCDYATHKPCNLVAHNRIHTGERPFHCHLCPQSFAHKCQLTIHVRLHKGERPYHCPVCPLTFLQASQMKCHLKRRHRDATQ
ncbi:hypothetical protein HPB49_023824 [Dermacentor silvarum]|uniref:Uncharacterized protein n=1 Tax=Dermacentor silvarum TaxID=543639 RepID=A0ACB8D0L1_DERSI|nr:hypothetical protein HPB49_023824 [Dermacentor silvarum]